MGKARATRHSGRAGRARHNDRDFDISKAEHIDSERTKNNYYWHCLQDEFEDLTFEQSELLYYQIHYTDALEAKNERYRKQRHSERCKTIDDVYKSKKTQPIESIFQIGNKDNVVVDDIQLMHIYRTYCAKVDAWNKTHGNHMHRLNYALHNDETSVHIHERVVWDIETPNGLELKQDAALKASGVELPDATKARGRFNNRKQSIDKLFRQYWIESCREHGLEIIEEPVPGSRHKDKEAFIDEQIKRKSNKQAELTEEISSMQKTKQQLEPYLRAKQYRPEANASLVNRLFNKLGINIQSDKDYRRLARQAEFVERSADALRKLEASEHIILARDEIVSQARAEARNIISEAKEQAQQIIKNTKITNIDEKLELAELRDFKRRVEKSHPEVIEDIQHKHYQNHDDIDITR